MKTVEFTFFLHLRITADIEAAVKLRCPNTRVGTPQVSDIYLKKNPRKQKEMASEDIFQESDADDPMGLAEADEPPAEDPTEEELEQAVLEENDDGEC